MLSWRVLGKEKTPKMQIQQWSQTRDFHPDSRIRAARGQVWEHHHQEGQPPLLLPLRISSWLPTCDGLYIPLSMENTLFQWFLTLTRTSYTGISWQAAALDLMDGTVSSIDTLNFSRTEILDKVFGWFPSGRESILQGKGVHIAKGTVRVREFW